MGANMARRLKDRGFHVTAVYDTNRAGATALASEVGCAAAQDLCGDGLFNRVHVADRPSYLSAIAGSAIRGETRSVEFRVRCDASDAERASRFVWIEMRCRPLDQTVLVSGPFAAETDLPLIPLGTHALRGIASPCAVFTVPEN